jgi:hypothetical protein
MFFLKDVQFPEIETPLRTDGNAGRLLSKSQQINAKGTLGHNLPCMIELRSTIGAGILTGTIGHTRIGINEHDTVVIPLRYCPGGTDRHARRLEAVHAGSGNVVGKNAVRHHKAVFLHPGPAPVIPHMTPADTERKIVGVFAGNLTGFAADTGLRVKIPG